MLLQWATGNTEPRVPRGAPPHPCISGRAAASRCYDVNNDTRRAQAGPRGRAGAWMEGSRLPGRREHPVRVVPDTYYVGERGGAPGLLRHAVGLLAGDLHGRDAGGCVHFVPERGVLHGRHPDEGVRVREAVLVEHGANRLKSGGVTSSCCVWAREEVCSIITHIIHQGEGTATWRPVLRPGPVLTCAAPHLGRRHVHSGTHLEEAKLSEAQSARPAAGLIYVADVLCERRGCGAAGACGTPFPGRRLGLWRGSTPWLAAGALSCGAEGVVPHGSTAHLQPCLPRSCVLSTDCLVRTSSTKSYKHDNRRRDSGRADTS